MSSGASKSQITCPRCGSSKVRYSHKQTIWDSFLDLLFSMEAFRCRSCRARFHKFDPGEEKEIEEAVPETGEPAEPVEAAKVAEKPDAAPDTKRQASTGE